MSRQDRMKASAVFRNTESFFGRKVPFEEAFPDIEDVIVEVEEIGLGSTYSPGKQVYTKKSMGEYIDCSNRFCYKGGFSIGKILREMGSKKQTDLETSTGCQGYEGSPKGRRRYRSCLNLFKIKVHIKYKEKEARASE